MKLGPVGASKALSLTAPFLLPMWDNPITAGYDTYPDESNYMPWISERRLNGRRVSACQS